MLRIGFLVKYIYLFFIILVLGVPDLQSQFYNGHQMTFGKNRVQYEQFFWQFYRYDKFDVYYYVHGKELALFTAKTVEAKIGSLEKYYQYSLDKRFIFIIFNKLSDFRQSNIGLVSENELGNIGGVTKIIDNKVFLYFEGDHNQMEKQIVAAMTEILINELLYGNSIKDNFANSTLLTIPEWYKSGLISWTAENWNFELEDKIKDGILSGKYEKFNHLTGEDAKYAGHSIWKFVAETYGEDIIPNIIYLTRISKNSDNGFLYTLGIPFSQLSDDWLIHYSMKYFENSVEEKLPDKSLIINKAKSNRKYQNPKISPNEKYIAYVTNQQGRYKIWLYDIENSKRKCILKREHKIEQITDYSYPIIEWHPSSKILSYITERKGKILFSRYELDEKKTSSLELFYLDKILDYSFSQNGINLAMSASVNSQTDIYIHNLISHTNQQITNDIADDFNPQFLNNSKQIIFSSNRKNSFANNPESKNDYQLKNDIYIADVEKDSVKIFQITNTPYINESFPYEIEKHKYIFLSDASGIINQNIAIFDSTINFIDTAIHYRYFTNIFPYSSYSRNISTHSIKNNKTAGLFEKEGRQHIYYDEILIPETFKNNELTETEFRKKYTADFIKLDSLKNLSQEIQTEINDENQLHIPKEPADSLIDIYNYTFEIEKAPDKNTDHSAKEKAKSQKNKRLISRIYNTAFYTTSLVTQIDFSFLNASYQTFTGGEVYFNPGPNVFFKLGTNDLFEDYRITGGVRLSPNLQSNEYLLSFENLKKRIDKQVIFHRQTFKNTNYSVVSSFSDPSFEKYYTHELMYILKFPFSQVSAIKGTANFRIDNLVFLSTDHANLIHDNELSSWAGLKFEYIFDNTISKGLNIYNGTRMKIFAESYFKMDHGYSDLFVVGADIRHYQKIHRNLIFASRFAASSSFGQSLLIYYLGGVDNWYNFSTLVPTFDPSIRIDESKNYVYQTVATNMRGFSQNIRNGNSFAVLNSELRFPFIRYFANRPISNDFIANLQAIGFADIGSAWTGFLPFSEENAYNSEVIDQPPVLVIIDHNKNPFVFGYGFGLRSRLFGYFVRADWAWGVDTNVILPRLFYLSLSLDF
ncbi:MAG: hypothetical protein HN704_08235 [Bacteroidetes bacterium]|nr:hypothetical protein [Bacteroidota bacterium]MBT6686905.1 hypothetical protein [Bacteroidota bacterium]MBT7144197.1 hypothetical protein [Bacteroidota bacterium]MBT7491580.1 hypothetical protein [Bacteroidota bacterium]